jgi:hypothetical protein
MGSFDCYCALCSGPLSIGCISFGSRKEKALRKRRRGVEMEKRGIERMRRKRAGEKVEEEDDGDDEDEDEDEEEGEEKLGDEKIGKADDEMAEEVVRADEVMEDTWEDENGDEGDGGEEGSWHSDESSGHSVNSDENGSAGDAEGDEQVEEVPVASDNGTNDNDDDEEQPDNLSQASSLDETRSFDMYQADETNSLHSHEEKHSYDPVKLSREDVLWIDRSRALAINKEWKGNKKVFLSGRGRYEDLVSFIHHAGSYLITKLSSLVLVRSQKGR